MPADWTSTEGLAELERLHALASAPYWESCVEAMPALVAEVRRLRADLDAARAEIAHLTTDLQVTAAELLAERDAARGEADALAELLAEAVLYIENINEIRGGLIARIDAALAPGGSDAT